MKKFGLLISVFLLSLGSFALNPSRQYVTTPGDYGMTYDTISIPTEDGLILKGWFFKATEAGSYKIIIISDDGDGNMADNMEIISNFITLGYNVVTYDYRGYGKSSDFTINNNFFIYAQFEKDIEAALGYVKKYQSKMRTVHLYGLGIGAGLSLSVGANHPEVSKIIADSPYSNFEEMKTLYKTVNNVDKLFPLVYNKNFLEPTYALEAKGAHLAGILFIAGENELIFTPKIAKKLSNLRSSVSSVYTVKGANTQTTFSSNKAKYFDEIKSFEI
jgi:pimeloyl-ACP methyl ester carboxylesterase